MSLSPDEVDALADSIWRGSCGIVWGGEELLALVASSACVSTEEDGLVSLSPAPDGGRPAPTPWDPWSALALSVAGGTGDGSLMAEPEEMRRRIQDAMDRGFRSFKIGWGPFGRVNAGTV